MDDLDEFLLLENPNELTFIESEVVTGKYDGEPVTLVRMYLDQKWITQFGMTETVLLATYHRIKKTCQLKGLL